MLFTIVLLYQIVIVFLTVNVKSQICTKHEVISRNVQETYSGFYRGRCGLRSCMKELPVKTRLVPRVEFKSIKYCCSGYLRVDDSSDASAIVCHPICMPACKNGYCKSPGQCACNAGHKVDTKDNHNCLPICEKGCEHGTCVGPNTCACDFGYELVNETCQPVCTEPCSNSICVSPETCECLLGYRKSDKNICEPYCSYGCDDNGYCAAPEFCVCNPGWHMTTSEHLSNKICKPYCSKPCLNGTCVAPDTCECLTGYTKSENNTCEPECKPGWKLEAHKCVPHCKYSCGNGTCVSPNICNCFSGYHIDSRRLLKGFTDGSLCVPTCADCTGDCVAPNKCEGEEISTTIKEDLCDKYQNCSTVTSQSTTYFSLATETTTDFYEDYTDITKNYNDFDFYFESDNDTVADVAEDTISVKTKDASKSSWIHQHWESVIIPIIVLIVAGISLSALFRWKPIKDFFKGRSYVVEGEPMDNGSYPFEDIQISSINDKDMKVVQL